MSKGNAAKNAQRLRREMTVSERVLWTYLRKLRTGFKFRRQHPFDPYVLDFFCPEAKVCVEVDGPHHLATQERDLSRDQFLATRGILTIRIPSADLFEEGMKTIDDWMNRIRATCEERSGRKADIWLGN